jgi:hypothetical protein
MYVQRMTQSRKLRRTHYLSFVPSTRLLPQSCRNPTAILRRARALANGHCAYPVALLHCGPATLCVSLRLAGHAYRARVPVHPHGRTRHRSVIRTWRQRDSTILGPPYAPACTPVCTLNLHCAFLQYRLQLNRTRGAQHRPIRPRRSRSAFRPSRPALSPTRRFGLQ